MLEASYQAVDGIACELDRLVVEGCWSIFRREGGLTATRLDAARMIFQIGPRRAAQITRRYVELLRERQRLYLLRPTLAAEHLRLLQECQRNGWLRPRDWQRRAR